MHNTTIGEQIERARRRAVLAQTELATAAGIAYTTLWRIETGREQPRPATLRKIAAALSLKPSELLPPVDAAGALWKSNVT